MTGFLKQTLSQLLEQLPIDYSAPPRGERTEALVTGVVMDSRQVEPGCIFVAISGGSADGHGYIPQAIERGAVAVVGSSPTLPPGLPPGVPYIQVPDARLALAYLAAAFYGFPARRLTVIGVTGTDGKTTTSNLIYNILQSAGLAAGIISTVNATIGGEVLDTGFHVTTPESPDVQRYLARMVNAGLTHVVLETTSHGLAQQRVAACEFDVAVVTNITHEHLDYHGSYAAYREAKGTLFRSLALTAPKQIAGRAAHIGAAVLNRDDGSYDYLRSISPGRVISYSIEDGADVRAIDARGEAGGTRFTCAGPGIELPIETRLFGLFNVSNTLAALAATVGALGIDPQAAAAGVAALAGVPGRMEVIDLGQPFTAMVDFAHTPNALLRALQAARQMMAGSAAPGRVIAVFGSAGLRDRQKRRMMAEVSARHADLTVLTAEDPRTESLDGILEEMAEGARAQGGVEGQTFWRVPDRGEAIRLALRLAQPGDLVMACGKGHEQSMCFGMVEFAWDDRVAMRAALSELLGVDGPSMPQLPTSKS